jgi:Cu(I)/Ag(I) efflux system membrane fusion protein
MVSMRRYLVPVFVFVCVVMAAAASRVEASDSLAAIVDSYLQIQAQLAADKVEGTREPARAIAAQAATMGPGGAALVKAANAVGAAADLEAARAAFGPLSDAVLEAGKAAGWKGVEGVRLAYCPMVKRSWLQKGEQIRNPYYGSQMLACGEFKELGKDK